MRRLYDSVRWRKKAKRQLDREPLCRICSRAGRTTAATVADHIVPHKGDLDLFWNGELQSLCASCHSKHKQAQEKGGLLPGCGVDGVPLDDNHPWNR